jgi:hypothetical protein
LNESALPAIPLVVVFPDSEKRKRFGVILGVKSAEALNNCSIGPGTVFALRLIDDMLRFTITFEPKGIGCMTRESIAIGSASVHGYLVSLVSSFRELNEPLVYALGDLAMTITTAVFTITTSLKDK